MSDNIYICEDCGRIIGEVEYTMFEAMCEECHRYLYDNTPDTITDNVAYMQGV